MNSVPIVPPRCDYCGRDAEMVGGEKIYPHRPDLFHKKFWRCPHQPCDAWVGCHGNSSRYAPLGRLANLELRQAKMLAHAAFDRLWRERNVREGLSQGKARGMAYKWLAGKMGLAPEATHIGKFDVAQCRSVVNICAPGYGAGRVSAC